MIVTFPLKGLPEDANGLSYADIEKTATGYFLILSGIFGLDGAISCERMSVMVEPAGADISQG